MPILSKIILGKVAFAETMLICSLTGFTKLMVATGLVASEHSSNVEVIDLEVPSSLCQNLEEYPLKLQEGSGGLSPDGSPIICGGWRSEDMNDCYSYEKNEWKVFPSLTEAKRKIKTSKSPFDWENFHLVMVAGYKTSPGTINTTDVLTSDGWRSDILPQLPVRALGHCILPLNLRTLIVITYHNTFFMSDSKIWIEGPALNTPRYHFSCGRTLKDRGSHEMSVISAGGYEDNHQPSTVVEVFNPGSSEWKSGPSLPFAITRSEMVEDPLGGVILIGGTDAKGKPNAKNC